MEKSDIKQTAAAHLLPSDVHTTIISNDILALRLFSDLFKFHSIQLNLIQLSIFHPSFDYCSGLCFASCLLLLARAACSRKAACQARGF